MKKIIVFLLLIFISIPAFAYDYREIIFGNNYKNIKECTDDKILKYFKSQKSIKDGDDGDKYVRLFEEHYENGTIYRLLTSYETLNDKNLSKIYENKTRLRQWVYIKVNGTFHEISSEYIYILISGDGTVRSWDEDNYGNVSVIERNNKIIGILEFNTAKREIFYSDISDEGETDDSDDYKIRETTERSTSANFKYWKDLQNGAFYEKWSGDECLHLIREDAEIPVININYSYPLIDKVRPFKYTIQNAFDGNPATSYVEDTEDDTIKISLYSKNLNSNCIKMKIINGYAQNERLYKNNNRIKVIDSLSEKSAAVILKDENLEPQIVNWIDYGFYVKELCKGTKYNDTCVAELDFQSENGNWIFEN